MATYKGLDEKTGAGVDKQKDDLPPHFPSQQLISSVRSRLTEENDDVTPSDSVSQQGSRRSSHASSRSSRSSSKSIMSQRARAITKEIELTAKVTVLKKRREFEAKRQELQRQLEEEEHARLQRRREMEVQQAELDSRQEELLLEAELEAAKAISRILEEDTDIGSTTSDGVREAIIRKAELIKTEKDQTKPPSDSIKTCERIAEKQHVESEAQQENMHVKQIAQNNSSEQRTSSPSKHLQVTSENHEDIVHVKQYPQNQPSEHRSSPQPLNQPSEYRSSPQPLNQPSQHRSSPQVLLNQPSEHRSSPQVLLNQPSEHSSSPQVLLNQPSEYRSSPQPLNQPSEYRFCPQPLNQPSEHRSSPQPLNQPSEHRSSPQVLLNQPSEYRSSPQPLNRPSEYRSSPQLLNQPSEHRSSPQLLNQPSEHRSSPQVLLNQPSEYRSSPQPLNRPSEYRSSPQLLNQPSEHRSSPQLLNQPSEQRINTYPVYVETKQPVISEDTIHVNQPPLYQSEQKFAVHMQNGEVHENKHPQIQGSEQASNHKTSTYKPDVVDKDGPVMSVLNQLVNLQREAALPAPDLEYFDGSDILAFSTFCKNFKFVVEDITKDPTRRLEMLLKYTRGEARELIKDCPLIEPPAEAYQRAKSLLKRDYGHPAIQATAYRLKAETWPQIKSGDKEGLRKYEIFLTNCGNARRGNSELDSMNNFEFLRILANKLPLPLQQQWIKVVGKCREDKNRSPTLDDFEKFVGQISRNENDPRIAGLGYQGRNNLKTTHADKSGFKKKNAFAAMTTPYRSSTHVSGTSTVKENKAEKKPCLYCGNGTHHAFSQCRKFSALKHAEKSDFCRQKGLCYGCVNPGHLKKDCPNPEWSNCRKCKRKHATVLHDAERDKNTSPEKKSSMKEQKNTTQEQPIEVKTGCVNPRNPCPLMTIIPVLVKPKSGSQCISTYAFMDSGSGAVFASEELNRKMNTRTRSTKLMLKTLNSEELMTTDVIQETIQVGNMNDGEFIDLSDVYLRESLPVSEQDVPTQNDLDQWEHLKSIKLPTLREPCIPRVTLMIGSNIPYASQPVDTRLGKIGEPYAIRSPLGWLVYGLPGRNKTTSANFCHISSITTVQKSNESLEAQLKMYMNMEFTECLSDSTLSPSKEDRQFLKLMEESAIHKNGHYEVTLPFRDYENLHMPNNINQASMYAERLRRRLVKNQTLHQQYTDFMDNLEDKGYAERVPLEDIQRDDGKVFYIPHHNVNHPQKKDKVRVVFNCPVSYQGISLNGQLLQGPDLTNSLIGVLLRFRREPVAVMADVESMFYQVRVPERERDVLRYLWWPKGDLTQPVVKYRMKVHVFGAVSSPSCANFAMKKCASDNESAYDQEVIEAIHKDFYVDDFVKSVETEDKAQSLVKNVKEVLAKGGFNLTKWVSNSRTVLDSVPKEDRGKEVKNLNIYSDILPTERTLGVLWNVESDKLGFAVKEVDPKATRRNILSVMSKVYDPIGPTSPFVLKAKQILQALCKEKVGWDEPVSGPLKQQWDKWLQELPQLAEVKIDRCYKPKAFGRVIDTQLHHFADASQDGYGTATYLRMTNHKRQIHCAFVAGKARVAPLKPHTIVKMELTAATTSVKQDTMLKKELDMNIDSTTFWTDSKTVLNYIQNQTSRFPVFVTNRLAVIHDGSNVNQWRYVPSSMNPADHASRGLSVSELTSKEWLNGPEFLRQPEDKWPESCPTVCEEKEDDTKLTNTEHKVSVSVVKPEEEENSVNKILQYYSNWTKLRRAVAWWLRLKGILQQRAKKQEIQQESKFLSVDEIKQAEEEVLKVVQQEAFPEEVAVLTSQKEPNSDKTSTEEEDVKKTDQCTHNKKKGINKSSSILNLDPEMNCGLLQVGGRLRNASIPEEAKHQLILPKKHHVVDLIINHIHQKCHHQGRNHTLAELRQRYWIVKAAVVVKRLLRRCVTCRKIQAKISTQKMADLPASRVQTDEPPFTRTGVDYFGPFEIKIGRTIKKRYGVIFTCMVSRAVHIEIADSLDTSSCINAIRRFISRRGQVKEITSDNGTNLKGASHELHQAIQELDEQVIQKFASRKEIKWKFNPPTGSHHGGVWERQIRTVRKILQAMLAEQHLKVARTEDQLHTLMCEIEMTINSRPLTRVSEDASDLDVITPNHLLQLRNPEHIPPGIFQEKDAYARRRWRQVQYLADIFWKRWIAEYLPMLQKRQKWLQPHRNMKVGDVVLVVDNTSPRNSWPMGVVEEVYFGKQGLVRSVKVKTKSSVLIRPITKLCLLLEQEL